MTRVSGLFSFFLSFFLSVVVIFVSFPYSSQTGSPDIIFSFLPHSCRQFGSGDFLKVFADFNDTATFELHPAVRTTTGACIEEANCNWELATVCAFNQTNIAGQVAFLGCMDDKEGTAKSASKLCAKATGLNEDKIMSCYNGDLGQSLLADASAVWNKAFPSRATVPHTFVDAKNVQADYNDLKSAICAAGSTASACSNKLAKSKECFA